MPENGTSIVLVLRKHLIVLAYLLWLSIIFILPCAVLLARRLVQHQAKQYTQLLIVSKNQDGVYLGSVPS
jgi:hypothetical protein